MELIINACHADEKRIILAEKIIQMTAIGHVKGFCVIESIDTENIGLISGTQDYGIYFSPEDKIDSNQVSQQISSLKNQCEHSHIVWLSSKSYKSDDIKFAWIIAHEFGHILQNIKTRQPNANKISLLRRQEKFKSLPVSCMDKNEIDSDLLAYEVCSSIFDEDNMVNYLNKNGIERCPFDMYPLFLREAVSD